MQLTPILYFVQTLTVTVLHAHMAIEHAHVTAYSRRCITLTAFRYSLPVLKIYSARYVYYKFSVLAVNIGTQPLMTDFVTSIVVNFND